MEKADKLGLETAVAASPGWSETGGPWVKPEDAMKKYVWSETWIQGGRRFAGKLAPPPTAEILRAQLPAEIESDAFGKQAIQLFHCRPIAGADAFHQRRPGGLRDVGHRSSLRHAAHRLNIHGQDRRFTHFPP